VDAERGPHVDIFADRPQPERTIPRNWLVVGELGTWNYRIVATKNFQHALADIVYTHGNLTSGVSGSVELLEGQTTVCPCVANDYFPSRLQVAIDGATVGYFAHIHAQRFSSICRHHIEINSTEAHSSGYDWDATVDARVTWTQRMDKVQYGVQLSLPVDFILEFEQG
jgi:hypothetical protein